MTATQFIYHAMLACGGKVPAPQGRVIEYEQIEPGPLKGDCWLCGAKGITGYPRKKSIKPTFTDANLSKAPWSEVVCDACTWAISRCELRNYSIIATGRSMVHATRQELRDALQNPPEPPFFIVVAESGQKWLHYKAQVNYSRSVLRVQFEDLSVRVEPCNFASIVEIVERMLAVFSKSEVATGDYQVHRIQQFGLELFETLEGAIRSLRGSPLFKLALHLATIPERPKTAKKTKIERRKPKCITASKPAQRTLL